MLMSLWAVDDRSTAELMCAFYSGLNDGLLKAEALQQAQRCHLQGETLAWRHPAHWAAFCLVGADAHMGTGSVRAET